MNTLRLSPEGLLGSLVDVLARLTADADSEQALLSQISEQLGPLLNLCLLANVQNVTSQHPSLVGLGFPTDGLNPSVQDGLIEIARAVATDGLPRTQPLQMQSSLTVFAAPIVVRQQVCDVLISLRPSTEPYPEVATTALRMSASSVSDWHGQQVSRLAETECEASAALIELVARMQDAASPTAARQTFVDVVCEFMGARQVLLGECTDTANQQTCRVTAISNVSHVDSHSDFVQAAASALDECLLRNGVTVYPPRLDADRHATLAHKRLSQSEQDATVLSAPLRNETGDIFGAWSVIGDESLAANPVHMQFLQAAERPVMSCLELVKRSERGRLVKAMHSVTTFMSRRSGKLAVAALTVATAVMFIPLDYAVTCQCEVQPVTRRFVTAPFASSLLEAHVEPGDIVTAHQVLATLDGREIRWEQSGVSADVNRAGKQRDTHLAGHEVAKAQIARLEMKRLRMKRELLDHRGNHLDVCSPIDGMIIAGDLKRTEGAPLSAGDTMFEVAPLDRMIFEIGIPDEDIAHVREGMDVTISLDAYPRESFTGTVQRIRPRSEIRDHEHVFVAEFRVDNPDERLRPGMQGQAKVTSDQHALGWNLFHKPWNKLRLWLGV